MTTAIQDVTTDDLPVLLDLIRELAQFERLEHEMQASVESLRDSFFGVHASAGALLARADGAPAGYAIYFFTFSSFIGRRGIWLEDVYVRPDFHRRGIGRQLMEAVARIGVKNNCGRFEWTALNWNQNALNIYRKMGAQAMDEWVLFRMNAKAMRNYAESNFS